LTGDTGSNPRFLEYYFNGEGTTLVLGEVVSHSTTTANTVLRADATADNAAARIIGFAQEVAGIASSLAGLIATEGTRRKALFVAGLTLSNGDEVFLSTTPGRVTNVAPVTSGNIRQSIGTVTDASGYTGSESAAEIQIIRGSKIKVP